MTRLRVATGIDLPLAPSAGSPILCSDVYGRLRDRVDSTFFCLPPTAEEWDHGFSRIAVCQTPKKPYGAEFSAYVEGLTQEVRRELSNSPYDLIHAQHLGYGLSLAFCRAGSGLPIISIAHGTDVIDSLTCDQAADALREIVESSTAVVVPNEAMREYVVSIAGAQPDGRIVTLPWGIPLEGVGAHAAPRDDGEPLRLLHAGRLEPVKSPVTAVESLAHMASPHTLTIVGGGSELESLMRRAAALRLLDRVTFKPFMSRQELWREFSQHDMFLFTTTGVEAFGLVTVEAQAHGLPVAYGDVDAMGETLGLGGIPYPAGDARALARVVDQLARDSTTRRKVSAIAIENSARFSVDLTSGQLFHLSTQVAQGSF
ncbi:glycosyltransferase family 4 protein [Streptomyces sp. NPDC057638]|uniref:glycosyltransferase family 4 protein n=1 Tax=Streptomyces sp. NPDC057638 TaxID=3346190 RepID=UPI003673B03C